MTETWVFIPIKLSNKIRIKRRYGKYPAKYINLVKMINKEIPFKDLLPRKRIKTLKILE